MKVVITGGAGFIGYHLAQAHVAEGDQVTLVDDLSKTKGMADPRLTELLSRDQVTLATVDLVADRPERSIVEGADIVYHLAALNGTRLFYEIPYEVARSNLRMTQNLLDVLVEAPPRRLVYASSSEVYADADAIGALSVPTDESAPVVFTQPTKTRFSYGTSKFMGEFLCLLFGQRYGVPATAVRYHNVYGPRMGHRHVIPELIDRIRGGQDPLEVFGMGESRAFCFVSDAVTATRLVAGLSEPIDVVHVGDPAGEIRIDHLAARILQLLGVERRIVDAGRRAGSVERRVPDITRLRRLTGFEPKIPLDVGLRLTVDSYAGAGLPPVTLR